ncbi:MAG: hypothetical protein JXA69_16480 [Phycisphaerae bacterium]|nr:hypothetical protein [Phycisphaerae bacterium]
MTRKQALIAALRGQERFARLQAVYESARPRRGRWGPGILTADEVFRHKAKDDGFSDEAIAMFIDNIDLWSKP